MELMSIGKFSKLLGISAGTLRNMEKEGKIIPQYISEGGTRYYSEEQLKVFSLNKKINRDRIVIGYCRVSTANQKDDLKRQIENIKMYMYAKGYKFEIISDIGSGINYKKEGLKNLINKICQKEVSKVVILYKDRLIRFGFDLIEYICRLHGTEIEIVDNTEKSKEQELVDDLIQIITVYANKIFGSRSKKTKELISEVKKLC